MSYEAKGAGRLEGAGLNSFHADASSGSRQPVDVIPRNSTFLKVLTAVPGLGLFAYVIAREDLNKEAKKTEDTHRAADITEVINHYKIASIVREGLTAAILVALAVCGVFHNPLAAYIAGGIIGGIALYHGYCFYQNKKAIALLRAGQSGVKIH